MPKLSKWIRNKVIGAHDRPEASEPALPPALPILPLRRQRVLTPSPSRENVIQSVQVNSAFFQRLPLELRRQIYIAAFGARTVHLNLRFDPPELPGPAHARLNAELSRPRDRTAPASWVWWSSVCHRNPILEGWEDGCRTGSANTTCFLYPGNMPEKCFLGVMGWLLTCRQAYSEGLDVLYCTNKVHIGSAFLTRHLPSLLLHQRLASIRALELLWDLNLFPIVPHPPREEEGWPAYDTLVATLASTFPSLENLYISIQTNSYIMNPLAENIGSHERKLLAPIDEMVRTFGSKLQECQIAPPRSLHRALIYRAESVGARIDSVGRGALRCQRFWRSVIQPGTDLGYWVRQGIDDTPLN